MQPIDPLLEILVGAVERNDNAEIGLTLFLPGGIIAGRLVGEDECYRTLEEFIRGSTSGLARSLADGMQ